MSGINSEINNYKEEIRKLKQELKNETEKRFSFKGDPIALNQSMEKEGRIKIEILDLENKINKLEAEKLKNSFDYQKVIELSVKISRFINYWFFIYKYLKLQFSYKYL